MRRILATLAVAAVCLWVWPSLPLAFKAGPFPDFDEDGVVGFADFLQFAGRFGVERGDETYEDRFDLDSDGSIGFPDFLIFAGSFGKASPYGGDENDVNIPDANLRAVIADSLGKSGDEAITQAEMATLTELRAPDAKIQDLTGLQFASNLTELWLENNAITDLGALCDLTKLTDLVLYSNAISDISALSNLADLHHLNLSNNTVSDISVLTDLSDLGYMGLAQNAISDLSALANLTGLIQLSLNDNTVSDISALANLTDLIHLELDDNTISDISVLSNLYNLTELNLNGNCVSDLSPLSNLSNLTRLNLADNRISDFSPLVANTGLGNSDEVDVRKNPLNAESLNTHIPVLQSRGVEVQFEDQPVLACIPILPKELSVDAGSSHTLQTNYLYVDHERMRPSVQRGSIAAVAYADFNEDGHVDVFYAPSHGGQRDPIPAELYLNDGTGCFTLDTSVRGANPPGRLAPRKALPGDFNGDGRMDVFVLDHGYDAPPFPGAAPYVILSSANGYTLGSGLETFVGFQHGGASADIDVDGDIDIFVTHSNSVDGPFFLINDGNGSFTINTDRIEGLAEGGLYTAELVDVDGDDFLDLVAAGHEYDSRGGHFPTQILWGDSTGVYTTARATILPRVDGRGTVVDIDVSDTDGDGDKDIVIDRTSDDSTDESYSGYFIQLVEQVGPRRFEDRTAQLLHQNEDEEANWIVWVRMCDCDADGDVDIVVDDAARNLIWKNDGTGRFQRR